MNDWVCVSDRLPDEGEWYLVSVYDDQIGRFSTMAFLDHAEGEEGVWMVHNDCPYDDDHWETVTHWMPLPELPK